MGLRAARAAPTSTPSAAKPSAPAGVSPSRSHPEACHASLRATPSRPARWS
ncbi:putative transcriptional regulator [Streptomyces sp. Tu6071]|nr:putative transcriptional regulator [Streptomyces sp. Tu6071]